MADQTEERDEDMITLVAEGRQFQCHKAKLVAASDYFRAMFSNNFTENAKNMIELQGIDADCLQLLLQYVESGSYVIPNENILALLQTSAMLQFANVQTGCEQQILSSLSSSSCLEVYYVTSALGLTHLAASALTVAVWRFTDIALTPQFLQLAFTDLVEYVSHPALYTGPEGEWRVWEALVTWIEENEGERLEHLVQLLLCLDFHAMSPEDLSNMLFYSMISDNLEAQQIIECIKNYKKNAAHGKDSRKTRNTKEVEHKISGTKEERRLVVDKEVTADVKKTVEAALRKPERRLPQVPCVVGFKRSAAAQRRLKAKNSDDEEEQVWPSRWVRNSDLSPVLYSFDLTAMTLIEEVTLSKLCEGPQQCSGYQVCAVGPSIYILGGEYQLGHGNWNLSLWRYSTASRKWVIENSLPQPRRHHMTCVLGSTIYLLGGFGRHRVIQSSMDAYDTESGDWMRCPDMPHCISDGAACAFKGRLMVFTQEMQLLTFYPSTQKWSAIPLTTPNKAGYRAALPWFNHIYLIDKCSTQVYRFSPDDGHTIACVGRFVAPPVNVCIVDGNIFSFSQDDLNDCHVIEILDISKTELSEETSQAGSGAEETRTRITRLSTQISSQKIEPPKSPKCLAVAKEVWRGEEPDRYMFTTKCPAEDTFSLGSFPLLRVKV